MSNTILYPGTEVKLTTNENNIYIGNVSHNGANLNNGPITLIIDKKENRFERKDVRAIEIIGDNIASSHYSMRGGKKSQRRKNKRNTKRNIKRNTKRRS